MFIILKYITSKISRAERPTGPVRIITSRAELRSFSNRAELAWLLLKLSHIASFFGAKSK
ncbi:hypothetical protein HanIR_Chr09g0393851 [Helianthus annuus]|nr:hypothetical protein HanIR_Chr09g0393851 [Helianthus annuus]